MGGVYLYLNIGKPYGCSVGLEEPIDTPFDKEI